MSAESLVNARALCTLPKSLADPTLEPEL